MSSVASGISANLARHILTASSILTVRMKLEKRGLLHVLCGVSHVGCGSRPRSSGRLWRDF